MKVKKLMWAYLLKHGTTAEWSFYGGGYSVYEDRARDKDLKVLRELSRDGVDWKKTQEPSDGSQSEFTDTFHEPAYVSVLEGTIITNKGKVHHFGTVWSDPRNVFEMFAELSELDFDDILKEKCLNKGEK